MLYKSIIKPFLDFVVALSFFLVVSPIFILVTILLIIHLKGSPFFIQKRPGKNERIFKIIKFKTMTDTKDADGQLLPDSERLTSLGKWVRSTSLDELPQLLNVLKGDMSFVGPRPLLPQYLPLYNDFQKQRHKVRPGITGWAQVNGRNVISWQKKFELDVFYVNHASFTMDLKILFRTFFKVIKSEGITDNKTQTVTYFTGNEE